jgi:hypothetical protein
MATVSPSKSTVSAIKAFFRIADAWNLKTDDRAVLLGVSERTVPRWKNDPMAADPSRDQVERLSYILGIYGGLHSILGEVSLADEWVARANLDFGDQSPMERMLAGNVGDLAFVRAYVDRWSAGI